MSYMFYFCGILQNLDISKFNTREVRDMSYIFTNCRSITNLNVESFNTGKVENMAEMFEYCISLKKYLLKNSILLMLKICQDYFKIQLVLLI